MFSSVELILCPTKAEIHVNLEYTLLLQSFILEVGKSELRIPGCHYQALVK